MFDILSVSHLKTSVSVPTQGDYKIALILYACLLIEGGSRRKPVPLHTKSEYITIYTIWPGAVPVPFLPSIKGGTHSIKPTEKKGPLKLVDAAFTH